MISFGAIASAVKRMKQKRRKSNLCLTSERVNDILSIPSESTKLVNAVRDSRDGGDGKFKVSKELSLKWLEEGKCQCCGADSGEFKGICDECRLS